MRKTISAITALFCTVALIGNMAVFGKTAQPDEDIILHGNKCGTLTVTSKIDRDVFIKIDCVTPDSYGYHYYDCVITADDKDNVLEFVLEGDNEAVYNVTVSTYKYNGSGVLQEITEEIVVYDTEDIDEEVSAYNFSFTVSEGEELESSIITENLKDKNNIVNYSKQLSFPLAENPMGDANMDLVVTVRDCALIATMLAQGNINELLDCSDYNCDGTINVRDAAAIASALAKGKL